MPKIPICPDVITGMAIIPDGPENGIPPDRIAEPGDKPDKSNPLAAPPQQAVINGFTRGVTL